MNKTMLISNNYSINATSQHKDYVGLRFWAFVSPCMYINRLTNLRI